MPINEPGLSGAVVRQGTEAHKIDGEWVVPMRITMPPELFEQYRQGYRCPACHSVQSTAFPERCETVWKDTGERCDFPIKDRLNEWLEFEFRGEETLWPDRDDAINEDREREDFTKRTGIWVP